MEYEEHEDQDEEMEIQLPKMEGEGASLAVRKGGGGVGIYCYRECLKNHAVGIGGHAVDGCGEFMPAGEEGTLDALKCAACSCHRNFHRRESEGDGGGFLHRHIPPYYRTGYFQVALPPNQLPLPLPSTSREDQDDDDDASNPSGGSRKRFRTKFSQEQKNKMLALGEELGWRIQKHDEAAVQQFCAETGVKRQVLKVWMHNNKHTLGRKP